MDNSHFDKQFEWIRSEQDLANERISAYTEADQKIIVVVGAIVAAVTGLVSVKYEGYSREGIPYILLLASIVMSLAVIQSSLYSSLALIYLERKYLLSIEMGKLLNCSPDLALSHKGIFKFSSHKSYKFSVVPYYLAKMLIGLSLCSAGYLFSDTMIKDQRFVLSFGVSLVVAILAALVVLSHAIEGGRVVEKMIKEN
ncbi:hypothetical protein [uncultured Methylobacterium sp.]|jgi:hypothetical protein|uniref:hypothetical protein n=1 Tax=uncultured Methylobacterium sp. TaxID=157278 RepID=UPI002631AB92|nr:hypothetical protein [uncultured Methylobacterium sp.]